MFLLIHAKIGIGVVTLPHDVFMEAKEDSWISVLLTGVMIQIIIFVLGALMMRFPSTNLNGFVEIIFGKWLGKLFIILYCTYFIILGGVSLAKFALILKTWMMPLTPKWVLIALIMLLAVYTVNSKESLRVIARFFFLSTFVLLVFIVFSLYALKDAHFTYLFPMGDAGILNIIKGIKPAFYSFQGFELLLFIYPFVQSDRKGLVKTASLTNLFITVFYTFMVLISLLIFSAKELKMIPEPVLYLVKSFTFKIVERPDLIFTSIWIGLVATTIIIILYVSSQGLSAVTNTKNNSLSTYIVAGIMFVLALIFYGEYRLPHISTIFNPFIFLFTLGLPILFLLIAIIFNKKEEANN